MYVTYKTWHVTYWRMLKPSGSYVYIHVGVKAVKARREVNRPRASPHVTVTFDLLIHWPSAVDWRPSSWYGTVYDDQEKNKIPPTPSDRSMKSKVQTPPDETCTLHVPLATQGRGSQCWCDLCLVTLLTTGVYLQQVFAKHIFKVCTSTPDEKDRQGRIVYRGCEGGPALVIFLFVLFFF